MKSTSRHKMAQTRRKLGLSQLAMGEKLGVSGNAVQSIELGRMKMSPRVEARLAAISEENVREVLEERVRKFREDIFRRAGIPLALDRTLSKEPVL